MGESYGLERGSDRTLLSKVYGHQGDITFTTNDNGKHTVCFKAESEKAQMFDMYRLTIFKRQGQDYSSMKTTKQDLTELELRITKALEQTKQIASEQQFAKYREATFRMTSNNVSSLVFRWGVLHLFALLGRSLFSIASL